MLLYHANSQRQDTHTHIHTHIHTHTHTHTHTNAHKHTHFYPWHICFIHNIIVINISILVFWSFLWMNLEKYPQCTSIHNRHMCKIFQFDLLPISDTHTCTHRQTNTETDRHRDRETDRLTTSWTSLSVPFGCSFSSTWKNIHNVHLDLDTPTLQTDICTKSLNLAFFQYLTDIQTHIHTDAFLDFASSFSIFHDCLSCLDGFLLALLSLAGEVNSEWLRL